MNKWYKSVGHEGDVVISTRVRLARNLIDFPFPGRMSDEQKKQVAVTVRDAARNCQQELGVKFDFLDMNETPKLGALSLVERHLVSPEFVQSRGAHALLLTRDETVSIMVCEEDHLRIQVMREGLCLEEVFKLADDVESQLGKSLSYAFDQKLGYLTQCPTNLGTGMRASVMLHLPAITRMGGMERVMRNVSKIGLTIRGLYGEGSKPSGELYQLSNQVTLGISEQVALDNLQSITLQLVAEERKLRRELLQNEAAVDQIFRSLGILRYARQLSGSEFMELISSVRLGVAEGLIPDVALAQISGIWIDLQPATLSGDQELEPLVRDKIRAERVRNTLCGKDEH